jgi:hypothetical protein
LRTADQLKRYCSNQELSRIEEVDLREGVAARERYEAAAMINDMISKDPGNPNLLIMRVRLFPGDRKAAIDDLTKARAIIAAGTWRETFTPSVEEVDDWLKALREESARDAKAPTTTNAAPVSGVR